MKFQLQHQLRLLYTQIPEMKNSEKDLYCHADSPLSQTWFCADFLGPFAVSFLCTSVLSPLTRDMATGACLDQKRPLALPLQGVQGCCSLAEPDPGQDGGSCEQVLDRLALPRSVCLSMGWRASGLGQKQTLRFLVLLFLTSVSLRVCCHFALR